MTTATGKPRLLIVEDDDITAELVSQGALKYGFTPQVAANAEAALNLKWTDFSALLLDINLPDCDGFDLLRRARRTSPDLPCFLLTSLDRAELAVAALKSGAIDYFTKPFDPAKVFTSIRESLATSPPPTAPESRFDGDWRSPAMIAVQKALCDAAQLPGPVLLIGETGTGRRSIAMSIHRLSHRSNQTFAFVDALCLTGASLETELFGGEERLPSGRWTRKRGKIETCNGGTLFVQEIDCLPPVIQGRLAEALEINSDAAFGSRSDFRLIGSARQDLRDHVAAGRFRSDLYYQLSGTVIAIPSLRETPEDLPVWSERLLTEICLTNRCRRPQLTRGALEAIADRSWPGNLDELRRALEQATRRAQGGLIGADDLPPPPSHGPRNPASENPILGRMKMIELERASLVAALEACNGNRRRAAKRLGVSLRTIYNMISRHNLKPLTNDDDG